MDYIQITAEQRQHMLAAIGARSLDELLADVPADVRLARPLEVPAPLAEQPMRRLVTDLAARDRGASALACFAGAGAYDHFIPAVVDAVAADGAFLTAYTPYQAEASQGSLQAFFEFQTLIAQLTGMDVANASLYEASTALAEAVLMLAEQAGRRRVVVCQPLHPHHLATLRTYLADLPLELAVLPHAGGSADLAALERALTPDTAAVVVQSPNLYGVIEPGMPAIVAAVQAAGAGLVQVFDPISLAILKRPGDYGVDVAVGEGQPLGIPLSFGGPYLGLFACRERYVRRMPGRLIGQTVDADGRRAFCLTLQTREQHIRRAKATSNICTNQGLMALRASVYLAAMGPHNLARAATLSMQRAHELRRRIAAIDGCELPFAGKPIFRELLVRCRRADPRRIVEAGLERGLLAGVPLADLGAEPADGLLIACTEKRTAEQVEALAKLLEEVSR